jgi:hypothetical protein
MDIRLVPSETVTLLNLIYENKYRGDSWTKSCAEPNAERCDKQLDYVIYIRNDKTSPYMYLTYSIGSNSQQKRIMWANDTLYQNSVEIGSEPTTWEELNYVLRTIYRGLPEAYNKETKQKAVERLQEQVKILQEQILQKQIEIIQKNIEREM